MLWSQQVEEEEARLHSSNPMPNKMMTLYYDHSDPANPVKATQYLAISGSQTFKQGTKAYRHIRRERERDKLKVFHSIDIRDAKKALFEVLSLEELLIICQKMTIKIKIK